MYVGKDGGWKTTLVKVSKLFRLQICASRLLQVTVTAAQFYSLHWNICCGFGLKILKCNLWIVMKFHFCRQESEQSSTCHMSSSWFTLWWANGVEIEEWLTAQQHWSHSGKSNLNMHVLLLMLIFFFLPYPSLCNQIWT